MKAFPAVTVFVLAVLASTQSHAQFGGGRRGEGGPGGPGGGFPQQERGDSFQNALAQDFQTHLDHLKEALKITPEQEAAWQAYEDRLRALMADMSTRPAAPPENQTALQKIDRTVDIARDRLTAMEDIAVAAKALYAKLSSEQKTVADKRLAGTLPQFYSEGGPVRGGMPGAGGFRPRPSVPPQPQ